MVVAIVFIVFAVLLAAPPATCQECPGPVSFTNDDFTITGPCPNDIAVVPVGSTIQYRCDYTDTTAVDDSPYWYIPQLSETPFLAGEGAGHGISISNGLSGQSRDSTIVIPVSDQYLHTTLSIQCGLCSGPVCYPMANRLNENITSTAVTLVTFGFPFNLLHTQTSSPMGELILSWSPSPVSIDYTNTVNFIYELTLTNIANSTQNISITTDLHVTTYTIHPADIPKSFDKCSNYTWSVTPMVGEFNGKTVTAPDTIYFPSAPQVNLQSVNFNFTDCTSTQKASIEFEANSCPSGGSPQPSIMVIADQQYSISNIETGEDDGFGTYSVRSVFEVSSEFDYESNVTVKITVSNDHGSTVIEYDVEDNINIVTCSSIPFVPSTVSSTSYSTSTPTEYSTLTSVISSDPQEPSSSPSVSVDLVTTNNNRNTLYASIIVPVLIVIVLIVVFCIVLVVVVLYYTKKKKASMKVTSETEYATIENNSAVGKRKAFMSRNENGNNVFKYENVSISTCSTPIDVSTPRLPLGSTTESDQQSQDGQTPKTKDPPVGEDTTDGLYAVPLDITNMRMNANSRSTENPVNHLMTFPTKGMDNPNYGKAMPGGSSRTEEAVYSMIGPDASQSNDRVVDMPGYSEVHIDPAWKKQRRSWHNTRVNSTPKHFVSSSLPTTPLHACIKTQTPPVFLKLGDIDETPSTPCDGTANVTTTTAITTTTTEGDDAVYDDIVYDKENIQDPNHPEYVAVDEIKKRKNNQLLRFSDDMIEMKELPPPTPTRDPDTITSPTPTSLSASPPPVPPQPLSPSSISTS